MEFIIYGEPIGKERPRHTKYGHTYTPEKTKKYEEMVGKIFEECQAELIEGYVKVNIKAYLSMPNIPVKSSKNKRAQMEADRIKMISGEIRPTKKPDTDNIAKIILDSLNKKAFKDDSQVIDLRVNKYYAVSEPMVIVTIDEVCF